MFAGCIIGETKGHERLFMKKGAPFFKYAESPTTVLAAKDRVTGHNPLGPVYLSGNYCSWLNKL
jgi:uncharacterized metal-binding protein